MKITVNGEGMVTRDGITLLQWLEEQRVNQQTVVIEYNGTILAKEKWSVQVLQDGDQLEILQFIGGG